MTSLRPLKSASETVPPPSRGRLNAGAFAPTARSFAIQVPSFRPFFGVNRTSQYAGKVPSGRVFARVRRPRQGTDTPQTLWRRRASFRKSTLLSQADVAWRADRVAARPMAESGFEGTQGRGRARRRPYRSSEAPRKLEQSLHMHAGAPDACAQSSEPQTAKPQRASPAPAARGAGLLARAGAWRWRSLRWQSWQLLHRRA